MTPAAPKCHWLEEKRLGNTTSGRVFLGDLVVHFLTGETQLLHDLTL
jgi:hypothetical protein